MSSKTWKQILEDLDRHAEEIGLYATDLNGSLIGTVTTSRALQADSGFSNPQSQQVPT